MKSHNILWDNPKVIEYCRKNYWNNSEWLDKNCRGDNNSFAKAIKADPELREKCSNWIKSYRAQPHIRKMYSDSRKGKSMFSDPEVYARMKHKYWNNQEWKVANLIGSNNPYMKAIKSDPNLIEKHRIAVTLACSTEEQRNIRSRNSKMYANLPEVKEKSSKRLKENNPMHNPEVSQKTAGDNHVTRRIKEPWRKSSANRTQTIDMWSKADILYNHWYEHNCSRYKLMNLTDIHVSTTIIDYFRNGWIPELDKEWITDFKS